MTIERSRVIRFFQRIPGHPRQSWREKLTSAIRQAGAFIVILSSYSLAEESFVHKEIGLAFEYRENSTAAPKLVIPVRAEECVSSDHRISELHWIDLQPSYERGKENLLAVLHERRKALRPEQTRDADERIFEALNRAWDVKEVATVDTGEMQIVADVPQVPESMYRTAITCVLVEVQESPEIFSHVKQIAIMNRFRRQGWVYETPEKYEEIVGTQLKELQLKIAMDTHLL
ncbi:MAG: TIR domain-containing protein [bacterium]|nr:TIR domain-containing protein [bacterium]